MSTDTDFIKPCDLSAMTDEALHAPRRVLIVDDNILSAKTTGWMLEMIGYEPTLSHDGREAVELAKTTLPDVILLDISLPSMNGYEVCMALRQDPRFANTLMIAQTGWGQEKDKLQAQEAGFNHHLLKPIDFEKLSGLLAAATPTAA